MKIMIDTDQDNLEEIKNVVDMLKRALERRAAERPIKEEKPIEKQDLDTPPPLHTLVPISIQEPKQETKMPTPPPYVDMSALTMSDYGQRIENRTFPLRNNSQKAPETNNNEYELKEIINRLKYKNFGKPIQMNDIIEEAKNKGINEYDTREIVNKLQKEGKI